MNVLPEPGDAVKRVVRPVNQRLGEDEEQNHLREHPTPAVVADVVVHFRVVLRDEQVNRKHQDAVSDDPDDDPLDRRLHLFGIELIVRMKAILELLEVEKVRHRGDRKKVEHPAAGEDEKHHAGRVRQT